MRRNDIVADELEPGAFDLAHERLVLCHLRNRQRALERMIGALKPGGWLLVEDFDVSWLPFTPDCDPADAGLFTKVMDAFRQVLEQAAWCQTSGAACARCCARRDDAGPSRSARADLDGGIAGLSGRTARTSSSRKTASPKPAGSPTPSSSACTS